MQKALELARCKSYIMMYMQREATKGAARNLTQLSIPRGVLHPRLQHNQTVQWTKLLSSDTSGLLLWNELEQVSLCTLPVIFT